MVVATLMVVQTPPAYAAPGDRCWVFSDGNDRLYRWDFDTSTLQNIGGAGVSAIEAIAWDPVTQTLWAANAGQLGTLNQTTGAFTATGPNFGLDLDGMAINPFTRQMFVSHRTGSGGVYDDLAIIDLTTFNITFIGPIAGAVDTSGNPLYDIDDLGFNPVDGRLYAATSAGGNPTLVRLAPDVGSVEATIGEFGVNDMEGLDYDAFGNLRGTTGTGGTPRDSLFDVNKTTGAATLVTSFTAGSDYEGIACYNSSTPGFNTITGTVFFDIDEDGVFGGGDTGTGGHLVYLYRDVDGDGVLSNSDDITGDGVLDSDDIMATATSASDGSYQFTPAASGAFVMVIEPLSLPVGHMLTSPATQTANFGTGYGGTDTGNNFGYTAPGELDVTKTSDVVGEADPGDLVTYTITVDNDSSFLHNNITVSDAVPPGTSWVSTTVTTPVASGVISTASDNFNTNTYSGGTGWLGPWVEDSDDGSPSGGLIRIRNDNGSPALQVGRDTNPPTPNNIVRGVNLSNAGNATLTFTKRDENLETGENVTIEIFNGSLWSTLVVYQGADPNDSNPVPQSFDISPYVSANTQIRIRPPADTSSNNDVMFFDDFVVTWEGRTSTTVPGGAMPNLVTAADGYDLYPNEVMTITVVVQVDDPLAYGIPTIDNTAVANSDDQLGNSTGSVSDPVNLGSIGDTLFLDDDGNGLPGPTEGIANITVTLTGTDGAGNPVSLSTTTDANGNYTFDELPLGDYTITADEADADFPVSVLQTVGTNPQPVSLLTGQDRADIDFGYRDLGSIGDRVFIDIDEDGVFDAGEGVPNITVTLTGTDELGNPVSLTTTTGADGGYLFDALLSGAYTVTVDEADTDFPADLIRVIGANPQSFALASGEDRLDVDFGYDSVRASLAGSVYHDEDNDGVFDGTESGIAAVTVTLTGVDRFGRAVSLSTTTDVNGDYTFSNVRPSGGTGYTVTETQPAGFIDGLDTVGSLGGTLGSDLISAIPLAAGD
ncbi:MAG: hypothetical protein OEU32_15670, partial [Acidimicrobiia bacterium]|nr:hypothetical protein [Acidimicrobiia bacterium]